MKLAALISIFLSSVLYSSLSFSVADTSITEKVDPDTIDPKMISVIYHISPKDLSIASYRQGEPSHFKVMLCRKCNEKTYQLSSTAKLHLNHKPFNKSDLALTVMEKKYNHITLTINRSTQSIDYLSFRAAKKSEFDQEIYLDGKTSGSEK